MDKEIKRALKQQKKKERREIKILLLGQWSARTYTHSKIFYFLPVVDMNWSQNSIYESRPVNNNEQT